MLWHSPSRNGIHPNLRFIAGLWLCFRGLEERIVKLDAESHSENPGFLQLFSIFQQYGPVRNKRALSAAVIQKSTHILDRPTPTRFLVFEPENIKSLCAYVVTRRCLVFVH